MWIILQFTIRIYTISLSREIILPPETPQRRRRDRVPRYYRCVRRTKKQRPGSPVIKTSLKSCLPPCRVREADRSNRSQETHSLSRVLDFASCRRTKRRKSVIRLPILEQVCDVKGASGLMVRTGERGRVYVRIHTYIYARGNILRFTSERNCWQLMLMNDRSRAPASRQDDSVAADAAAREISSRGPLPHFRAIDDRRTWPYARFLSPPSFALGRRNGSNTSDFVESRRVHPFAVINRARVRKRPEIIIYSCVLRHS